VEKFSKKLKVCFLDIETSSLDAESGVIVGVGIMDDDGNLHYNGADSLKAEKALIKASMKTLANYDLIITWNGESYDVPYLITRALKHGVSVDPLFKAKRIDLREVAKRVLKLHHHSLDHVCRFLGVKKDATLTGADMPMLYLRVLEGDKKASKAIKRHCHDDLRAIRQVFNKMKKVVIASLGAI
jgi:hypothetical protein